MKKQINPAPLVTTLEELQKQITGLDSVANEFDIDLIDWERSDLKTVKAVDAVKVKTTAKLNFDIQMDKPEETLDIILNSGRANRVLVNLECDTDIIPLLKKIRENSVEAGISIDPENKIANVIKYFPYCDLIQIMTISPGLQGNPFLPDRLALSIELRELGFDGSIEIDGGVNLNTLDTIKQYPINVLSIGSALSKAEKPIEAYLEIQKKFVNP
jgi:ribulose-phosphate 3-epimerase